MALKTLKGVEEIGGYLWPGFKYSPQTGNLYRSYNGGRTAKRGIVGVKNSSGYLHFGYKGHYYRNHRVIYEIMVGLRLGKNDIVDHINGNINDNRWSNLRKTNSRGNSQNKKIHREKNKLPGWNFHKASGKYISQIYSNGKQKYLGIFNTPEEARSRYLEEIDREKRGVEGYNKA